MQAPPAAIHNHLLGNGGIKGETLNRRADPSPGLSLCKKKKKKFQRSFFHLGLRSPFFPSSGCRHPPPAVKHRCSLFSSPPLTAGEGQKFPGCLKRRESVSAIWPRKGLLVDFFELFFTDFVCFILNKSV
ncbi:hypothetical protein SLA2020_136710 [Shorea laevis]